MVAGLEAFVVDDHSMVRKGVAMLINELGGTVVAEAASLAQARGLARTTSWTMMVLDLNLPDGDGLDLLQDLRRMGRHEPVLVHSLMPDSAVTSRVLKAGAAGFISKTCEPEEFLTACRSVMAGSRFVTPAYAALVATSIALGESPSLHERLSEREYQVMCLIAAGKTPTEIAGAIGCHVNTISTFRARVLKKLELKNSMDIMKYAISHKLVALN